MAQAVQDLFPQAKLGIGPPVENGFYYDFDVDRPFTPEDLKAIEGKMRQIVKQGQRFSRRVVTDEQAAAELAAEPYKLELIGLKGHASGSASFESEESVEVGGNVLTKPNRVLIVQVPSDRTAPREKKTKPHAMRCSGSRAACVPGQPLRHARVPDAGEEGLVSAAQQLSA